MLFKPGQPPTHDDSNGDRASHLISHSVEWWYDMNVSQTSSPESSISQFKLHVRCLTFQTFSTTVLALIVHVREVV